MTLVLVTHGRRNQGFHIHRQQFLAGIAKHGLGNLIDQYDLALGIDFQYGVRGGLQESAKTIFFARFIFGMRIIAGPLAGVLRMPWRRFLLFNFLGAVVWVSTIASVGYAFGSQRELVMEVIDRLNIVVFVIVVAALAFAYWRFRVRGGNDRAPEHVKKSAPRK